MKPILPLLILILTATLNIQSVYAQEVTEPELQNVPPEEREAARQARLEQIQNMTEEERAAAREQARSRREERIANMSEEERAAAREQLRSRREERMATMTDEQRAAMQNRRQERRANGDGMRGNRGGTGSRPGRRNN